MPYIDEPGRTKFLPITNEIGRTEIDSKGELNYLITSLLIQYMIQHGLKYDSINDVLGAVDGAGKEFYRRVAVPYENAKIDENGDVYPRRIIKIS